MRLDHSICGRCWNALPENVGRPFARERDGRGERAICCWCGWSHASGIYLRGDPEKMHAGYPCSAIGETPVKKLSFELFDVETVTVERLLALAEGRLEIHHWSELERGEPGTAEVTEHNKDGRSIKRIEMWQVTAFDYRLKGQALDAVVADVYRATFRQVKMTFR